MQSSRESGEQKLIDGVNTASNDNTVNLSREKEAFCNADKTLILIYTRVLKAKKIMNEQFLPLFRSLKSSGKNKDKVILDAVQQLTKDIKLIEDHMNDTEKKENLLNQGLTTLYLLILKIRDEFVTRMSKAVNLDFRKMTKSLEKIEKECIKFVDFLVKYSDQLKRATGILQTILVKANNNTINLESERNSWNKTVCEVKNNVEAFSSKLFSEIKVENVIVSKSHFSEILNLLVI